MTNKELTQKETYDKKASILFNSRLGRKGDERAMLFSNFQPFTFTDNDGVTFHSTEQRFQWLRLRSKPEFQRKILTYSGEGNGWDCKAYVTRKQVKPFVDMDVANRIEDMRDTLKYKVLYCPNFKDELIATGNQTIIEYAPWGDDFWGAVGSKGNSQTLVGANVMGKLLMELREELTQGKTTANTPVEPKQDEPTSPDIKTLYTAKEYSDLSNITGNFQVTKRDDTCTKTECSTNYKKALEIYNRFCDDLEKSSNPSFANVTLNNNIIHCRLYETAVDVEELLF